MKSAMMMVAFAVGVGGCGSTGSGTRCIDPTEVRGAARGALEIKLATVYVDDQAKALRF